MSEENNAQEFIFVWEIYNFSLGFYKINDAIDSPVFEIDSFGGSQWCIRLYPCGENRVPILRGGPCFSCYLCKKKNDVYSEESSIAYELEMITDGKSLGIVKKENCIYKLNEHHGFERYLFTSIISKGLKTWAGNVLTVRCHMFNTVKKSRSDFIARTEVPVNRISFLWSLKISDISSQLVHKDFTFSEESLYGIALSMPNDTIKICISQKDESILPMLISCKLSLVNLKGKELKSLSSSHLFETNDKSDVWELPSLITKADLDSESDSCSLFFEIIGSHGINSASNCISSESSTTTAGKNRTVFQDLKNMLHNRIHSDIKVKAEDQVLHAHKSILAARSPVFSAMFAQDMIESKTGVVEIPDLESEVLKLFLEFLYTDTIEDFDLEKAKKLFLVAVKYQVSSLTEKCATFLETNLSLKNATEILSVADMISHKRLKKVVMNFIAGNSAIIFNTHEWQDLIEENVKLAGEMISVITSNFKVVPNN